MMIATIILIIWLIMLFVNDGEMLFEWWWLVIAYIVEIVCYIVGFIIFALITD